MEHAKVVWIDELGLISRISTMVALSRLVFSHGSMTVGTVGVG